MANALYAFGRQFFLDGDIDWSANNIKAYLIDEADDTIDLNNDQDLADRAGAAIVATSGNMSGKTSTGGTADCSDFSWSSVTGDQSESVDFAVDTGTPATSLLICNIDTASGLPVTPVGTNINFTVNASGLFIL